MSLTYKNGKVKNYIAYQLVKYYAAIKNYKIWKNMHVKSQVKLLV